jgi:LysM repeat protein
MRAHRSSKAVCAVVVLAFLSVLSTGPYTVRRGDTLAGIAARNGTTAAALAAANGISNPNRIRAGQVLTIPGTTAAGAPAPAAAGSYTVSRGDTLGSIAARHGTTISALVALNHLRSANLVRIGQVLAIPGATSTVAGSPAPVAPPAGVVTPAGGALTHVVRAGESLGGVARRYGVPMQQIVDANGLSNQVIYVGQQLRLVPIAGPAAPAAPTGAVTHTVAAGQTLSSIAARYGVTPRAIQDHNGIKNANLVVAGQVLEIPGATGGSGGITCPVQGPVHFMNDWGFPRSGGRFHQGNDLFAARGTPAVATVAGTVVQTVGRLGGNQVKLLGDDGVSYYYRHLDRFGTAGHVAAGTVIGYVGSTGNAAGGPPHVHFEIHPGGGPAVNPYPTVAPAC